MSRFQHSDRCPAAIDFISSLLRTQGPQTLFITYHKANQKGAVTAVLGGSIDNTKDFILNHQHYFDYNPDSDLITPATETKIVWPFQPQLVAIEYFKKKLEKHKEVTLQNLSSHFGQAPVEVLEYLSMGGKPNRLDKLVGLIVKNVSEFVLCGNRVKLVTTCQAETYPEPINLRMGHSSSTSSQNSDSGTKAKERRTRTRQGHSGKDPSTFEHTEACASAVSHVQALLEVTGEQTPDSLLIILETASPSIKHVTGSSKRALNAFILTHSHYFKFNQSKKTISNNKFFYSWPPSVETSAVAHLQQMLRKHSSLEVDKVRDHYTQASDDVKLFLSGEGGNYTAKLCSIIVKHPSLFVICGNEVKLANASIAQFSHFSQENVTKEKSTTGTKDYKGKDQKTESSSSFNHSEKCRDGIRFLLEVIAKDGPKQPAELAFKVRQSAISDAFPEHKGFIKTFTENHPHYFVYKAADNQMNINPLRIKWRPGNIRNMGLAYLKGKLAKGRKIHVNSLENMFNHGPGNVKAVLSKMKGSSNEKIICLIRSCMDQFVICGDRVQLTKEGIVPIQPIKSLINEQGPPVLSGITGNITGKVQENCAFISSTIGGSTVSVFFEKSAYIGSHVNLKLPLNQIVVVGERMCFDAVLGPPKASCKYKATRVWKADMPGQVSGAEAEKSPLVFLDDSSEASSGVAIKETAKKAGSASAKGGDLITLDFMPETGPHFDEVMSLAGFASNDFSETTFNFDDMLYPEKMSQDSDFNMMSSSSQDQGKLHSLDSNKSLSSGTSSAFSDESSDEEEENLSSEIGAALVDATSKIIKKYQRNRSTSMTDLQAGISICVNHLNAVAAVLKSVQK